MTITIKTDAVEGTYEVDDVNEAVKLFSQEEGFSAITPAELRAELEACGGWVHFFDKDGNLGL